MDTTTGQNVPKSLVQPPKQQSGFACTKKLNIPSLVFHHSNQMFHSFTSLFFLRQNEVKPFSNFLLSWVIHLSWQHLLSSFDGFSKERFILPISSLAVGDLYLDCLALWWHLSINFSLTWSPFPWSSSTLAFSYFHLHLPGACFYKVRIYQKSKVIQCGRN